MAEYTIGADKCLTNVNTAINANVNPKVQALQAAINLVDGKVDGIISGMLINKLTNVDGSSAVVDVIDSCKDGITIYTLKICTDNNYPIALNLSGADGAIVIVCKLETIGMIVFEYNSVLYFAHYYNSGTGVLGSWQSVTVT